MLQSQGRPGIALWGFSPPDPVKRQPADAPSPEDITRPGHVLAGVGANPGGSSLEDWDRSEGGCWAAGQTAPGPPWEHPKRWHPTPGNTQVSQGHGPMLSRTKTEILLLRHPRRRCLRSICARSGCGRRRESHPAVCERLPAPTCKNKLGNWDQLPSLYVSKPRRCLSPAPQGSAGPSLPFLSPHDCFPREKAFESLGCAEREQRRLPLTLTGFYKPLLKGRAAPFHPNAEAFRATPWR